MTERLRESLSAVIDGEANELELERVLSRIGSDDEVRQAMALAFRHLKLVVEPGGAVALAAALCGKLDIRDRTAAIVISGGNVDARLYADVIAGRD